MVEQLRLARCTVREVDVGPRDPFIDHYTEWWGRAHRGACDVIAVVEELSPAAVALAVLTDAPVVRLPHVGVPSLLGAVEDALRSDGLQRLPVAAVTADTARRFTMGTVVLTADRDLVAQWSEGETRRVAITSGCELEPLAEPTGTIALRMPGRADIHSRRVEVHGDEVELHADFDGRSRRVRRVVVRDCPAALRSCVSTSKCER